MKLKYEPVRYPDENDTTGILSGHSILDHRMKSAQFKARDRTLENVRFFLQWIPPEVKHA